MAASDPTTRREAASVAARHRIAGMTDEQRRDMTAAARRTLRERDLRAVDDDARRRDEYPLPDDERERRVDLRRRARAKTASLAAAATRRETRSLAALQAEQARVRAADLADRAEARATYGTAPSLGQLAARRQDEAR